MTDRDTPRVDAVCAPWIEGAPDAQELRELIDFAGQLERELADAHAAQREAENELSRALAQHAMAMAEKERELAEARRDQARYRGGYEAACVFIDSHVADPDITPRMCATYAAFEAQRAAIDAATAPAPTPPQS